MLGFADPTSPLLMGWQANVNSAIGMALDGVTDAVHLRKTGQPVERAGLLLLFSGVSAFVNRPFSLTAHELRHMETARSIGASHVAIVEPGTANEISVGQFFLRSFVSASDPGLYEYVRPGATLNAQAYVAGAGLNANLQIAESISSRIVAGLGQVTDLSPYLWNKLWGINYFLDTGPYSDAARYLDLLEQEGFGSISARSVVFLHSASLVLSGGFLALAAAQYEFLASGRSSVVPLALELQRVTFYWPEMTTWLNPDNISLELSEYAAIGDHVLLGVAIDQPTLGNLSQPTEFTVEPALTLAPVRIGLGTTFDFSGVPFLLGRCELLMGRHFLIGIEGHWGRGDTMRELREFPLGSGVRLYSTALF